MIDASKYDSLQTAVNIAIRKAERLFIPNGTYTENITISPQQYHYVVLDVVGEGAGFGNMPGVTLDGRLDIVSARKVSISGICLINHGIEIDPVGTIRGSSVIEISDFACRNPGECALSVSPGDSQNADRITLRKFWAESGKYGISINQSQSRAFNLYDCSFDLFHTVLVSKYGKKQGSAPNWYGGQVGRCGQLLDFPSAFGQPLRIDGLHMESTAGIGTYGSGRASSRQAAIFTGGYFDLLEPLNEIGYDTFPAMTAYAPVLFQGTQFSLRPVSTFEGTCGYYTFESCTSHPRPTVYAPHEWRSNCYSW